MTSKTTGPILFEPLPDAPAAIAPDLPAPIAAPRPAKTAAKPLLAGLALLLAVWLGTDLALLIADAWARAPILATIAGAGLAAATALIALAIARDTRGYRGLRRVDRLRALLAGHDLPAARQAATDWAASLTPPMDVDPALHSAASVAELRLLLADRIATPLAAEAERMGLAAAVRAGALIAACPHPALDALVVTLVALRLIRDIAARHGLRPGATASLALLRRVGWAAATTAATDLAAQTLADQALQHTPVIKHLAAAVPGASLAAFRLRRLAQITARACSPAD